MTAEMLGSPMAVPMAPASPLIDGRFRLQQQVSVTRTASAWKATDELLRRTVTVHVLIPGAVTAGLTDAARGREGDRPSAPAHLARALRQAG